MKFNRYRAFAVHFLGSVIVASLASALVFLVWYPGVMPAATGVTEIFLLMLGVDVVLGPCITLIIFNPAKKELRRDLAVVLIVQCAALVYGLHAVLVARPVYVVYNVDRFDLVFANDLSIEKLSKVKDQRFKKIPWLGFEVIAAKRPESVTERRDIMFSAVMGGDDVPQFPQYYVPYAEQKELALKRILSVDVLRQKNVTQKTKVEELVARYAARSGGIGYLPLRGKVKDLAVIVAKDSADVLEITDLSPW